MRRLVLVTAAVLGLAFASSAGAQTFYVSSSGSDGAAGTSQSSAWHTVNRVNNATLSAGDTVLFEGGSTFGDATLQPAQSGASGAPITFGSYGSGQANLRQGIWFSGKSWLTFSHVTVDAGSAPGDLSAIQASASGGGSTHVVVDGCTLQNVRIGVNVANPADGWWTIRDTKIQYTRDSGAIVWGHDVTFTGNTILDTGQDSTISYGKHGVYAKGPSMTFRDNVIRRFSADGISLRFPDATVVGNTISDGPIGIAWFQSSATAGSTLIAYNKISDTSSSGIYVSPSDEAGATKESFVVVSNSVRPSGGNAMDVAVTTGSVTIANNSFSGPYNPALHLHTPGGAYAERNNSFWNASSSTSIDWNGSWLALAAYESASGAGTGDAVADPKLDASFLPTTGSALIDAGSASVSGVSYAASCDGQPFHYCGTAPDDGAVETGTAAPAPVPLVAPTGLAATNVTGTALTLTWTPSADARVTSYQVSVNGAVLTASSIASLAVSGLTCATSYTFTVRGVDAGGATSTDVILTVSSGACPDTTAPWVLITSPTMNQSVPRSVVVRVDATDASGIRNVTFWVDSAQKCVVTVAPYTCSVSLRAGKHTLLVRATDQAGNVAWMSVKVNART